MVIEVIHFMSICSSNKELTLQNDKIIHWSKLKAFADNRNKIRFSLGRSQNILGKGESAAYQHFLLFPQCFQKASFPGLSVKGLTHYHTMLHFDALKIYSCGKLCEKRRNCL